MKQLRNYIILSLILSINTVSCQKVKNTTEPIKISNDFKAYWYQGKAEISTYELSQSRYGEPRKGTATLIYVTEEFLPKKQVKADRASNTNIPVLKLNSVKKFNTGVYPYSIMQSTFTPLKGEEKQALKITASIQEWCGQTFMQLNNKEDFEITTHSYFASEGDQQIHLKKDILENELWNSIRLNGAKHLAQGKIVCVPSFEFFRLDHKQLKSYEANASLKNSDDKTIYTLFYPELKRSLKITFTTAFPHIIESWSEQTGQNEPTTAKRITTKLLPYWRQNSNKDNHLRSELGLH